MKESEYKQTAQAIRVQIIKMLDAAGSGHLAGPLGLADVLTVLYASVLRHRPSEPTWADRDRFVLSCGHLAPLLYATLAQFGYFLEAELQTLRKLGSPLQGHPHWGDLPGVESSSGSLGQGISQAVGLAIGASLMEANWRVYCAISDGELQEGQTWEAIMLAGARQLDHFTLIIDRNHIQISGQTEAVLSPEPLKAKLEAFQFYCLDVDGHNYQALQAAFAQALEHRGPVALIAHTTPGKGVDFVENQYQWHGKMLNPEELTKALKQLS